MAEALTTSAQVSPEYPAEQQGSRPALWQRVALGTILLISVFMNFYKLGQVGFDSYYPPAVRSMMDNWHNFFFAAYDPGGFTSIDKPPVGFWLQVLSAKIFGLTPVSVLLPQALAGVLAVLLLYWLVRRHFGIVAGLLAALFLALSPISIVTNRNVTIDSTLALVLLLGAWAVLRAAETGKLRWLLLCAAMVGVGFNIKMLEAYLVLPAFGLLYLLAAPRSIWTRFWHLGIALLLLLVISFSWALAVDLTPTAQRPHVGATQDNSEIGLALGYNGLQRLLGVGIGGGSVALQNGVVGAAPFHLFTEPLAGQNGWLLPLAILGMIALAWQRRPRFQHNRTMQSLLLWGMWLLTMGVFFSFAQFTHEYYLTVMAPAIAALCGIGVVTMWQDYRRPGWRGWLLPLALIATTAEQVYILTGYADWSRWMIPLLSILCLLAVGVLIGARLPLRFTRNEGMTRMLMPALSLALVTLLLGPTLWAAIPIFGRSETDIPLAGPGFMGMPNGTGVFAPTSAPPASPGTASAATASAATASPGTASDSTQSGSSHVGSATNDPRLIRYLEDHQGRAQVLVATNNTTDGIILATNKSVIPLAGFSRYPLTTTELASMLAKGTIRFFLLGTLPSLQDIGQSFEQGNVIGSGGALLDDPITPWVTQHCKVVPPSLWQSSTASSGPLTDNNQLYDCATTH